MTTDHDTQVGERATRAPADMLPALMGLLLLAVLAGSATWLALVAAEQFLPTEQVSGVVSAQGVSRDSDGDETYWTRFRLTSGDEVRTSGRALYRGTSRGTEVHIELGQLTSRVMAVEWQSNGTDVRDANGSILIVSLAGIFGLVIITALGVVIRQARTGEARRWQLSAVTTGVFVTIVWQVLTTPSLGPR